MATRRPALVVAIGAGLAIVTGVAVARQTMLLAVTGGLLAAIVPSWLPLGAAVVFTKPRVDLLPETHTLPLTLSDALLLAWLLRRVAQRARWSDLAPFPPARWLGAFMVWAWAGCLVAGASTTALGRVTTYAAIAILGIRDRHDRRRVLTALSVYALVVFVASLPEGASYLDGAWLGDPHQAGMLFLAGAAPLLSGELATARYRNAAIASRLAGCALLLGAVFTFRRGIWAAVVVMALVAFMPRANRARIAFLVVAVLAIGYVAYTPVTHAFGLNVSSFELRQQSIVQGIREGTDSPLFGRGWAAFSERTATELTEATPDGGSAYNTFVNLFAATGIVGVTLFAGFLLSLLRRVAADRTVLLFTVAFVTLSFTETTLYAGSLLTLVFFVYAGLARVPPRRVAQNDATANIATLRAAPTTAAVVRP
jgi:hypothetical protein